MESEYVALSVSMRDLLPLQKVLHDISVGLGLDSELLTCMKCEICEDNKGALTLAKMAPPRLTPRSKKLQSSIIGSENLSRSFFQN